MPDETSHRRGLLTQEELSLLISIETTLGCGTCLWMAPDWGNPRGPETGQSPGAGLETNLRGRAEDVAFCGPATSAP